MKSPISLTNIRRNGFVFQVGDFGGDAADALHHARQYILSTDDAASTPLVADITCRTFQMAAGAGIERGLELIELFCDKADVVIIPSAPGVQTDGGRRIELRREWRERSPGPRMPSRDA